MESAPSKRIILQRMRVSLFNPFLCKNNGETPDEFILIEQVHTMVLNGGFCGEPVEVGCYSKAFLAYRTARALNG